MKDSVQDLYDLQVLDNKIYELNRIINSIPKKIQNYEDEKESKSSIIAQSKQKFEENLKGRKKIEKEILMIKENIKKRKDQLNNARTNMEYQGLNSEIKNEEGKIVSLEEQIIAMMLDADEIAEEVKGKESEYKEISLEYDKKISALNDELAYQKGLVEDVKNQRKSLKEELDSSLYVKYQRLAAKKSGVAVSQVESGYCRACNIKIRPQVYSQVIIRSDNSKVLTPCENCGRILFFKRESHKSEEKQ